MNFNMKLGGFQTKIRRYHAEYAKFKSDGDLKLKLAKEKMADKLKEAKKLESVEMGAGKKLRDEGMATAKQSRLKTTADTERTINGFKSQLTKSLQQLKQATGGGGASANAAMLSKAKQTMNMMIKQSTSIYKSKTSSAKSQMNQKLTSAISIIKQNMSKSKLKMKQEIDEAMKAVTKAKGAEKKEEAKVDALKATAKADGKASKENFLARAKEKYTEMMRLAKKKQHERLKKANEKFDKNVQKDTKKRLPKIAAVKKKVKASFGGPGLGLPPREELGEGGAKAGAKVQTKVQTR